MWIPENFGSWSNSVLLDNEAIRAKFTNLYCARGEDISTYLSREVHRVNGTWSGRGIKQLCEYSKIHLFPLKLFGENFSNDRNVSIQSHPWHGRGRTANSLVELNLEPPIWHFAQDTSVIALWFGKYLSFFVNKQTHFLYSKLNASIKL